MIPVGPISIHINSLGCRAYGKRASKSVQRYYIIGLISILVNSIGCWAYGQYTGIMTACVDSIRGQHPYGACRRVDPTDGTSTKSLKQYHILCQ